MRVRFIACAVLALGVGGAVSADVALRIVTPAPDETIHDNSGTVPVIVTGVEPGAALRAVLDGVPSQQVYAAPAFELTGVPRGTHFLSIVLLDADGNALQHTPPVRFYVWQASRLN